MVDQYCVQEVRIGDTFEKRYMWQVELICERWIRHSFWCETSEVLSYATKFCMQGYFMCACWYCVFCMDKTWSLFIGKHIDRKICIKSALSCWPENLATPWHRRWTTLCVKSLNVSFWQDVWPTAPLGAQKVWGLCACFVKIGKRLISESPILISSVNRVLSADCG